jgi:F-type H+-transporting ATPase subunit delta
MKNARVARRYAQALMLSAESSTNTIDAIAGDLEIVKRALDGSRDLQLLLTNPVVRAEKKIAVLREIFRSHIGMPTMTFLELLTEKQREAALPEVIERYNALRDEKYGIVNVEVSSAVEISPQQEKTLAEKLERYTKKKVRVRFALDTSLRGGMVVRIGDTVLDASVKRQLELMRERFVDGHALN